jgi:hypothetical protein
MDCDRVKAAARKAKGKACLSGQSGSESSEWGACSRVYTRPASNSRRHNYKSNGINS